MALRLGGALFESALLTPKTRPSPSPSPSFAQYFFRSSHSLRQRPCLDDVERLSRGDSTKSKIGSRSVPHRLNADERKAYELAKKKGYLVRQLRTRQYPLSNTYRNFCDALGWPCLRIDQGGTGSGLDTVIVDMSTMRLQEPDSAALRSKILEAYSSLVGPETSYLKDQTMGCGMELSSTSQVLSKNLDNLKHPSISESQDINGEQMRAGALHFYLPRKEAKHLSEAILGCCREYGLQLTRKPSLRT